MSESDKPLDSLDNLKTESKPKDEKKPEIVKVKSPRKEDFIDKANEKLNPFNTIPSYKKNRLTLARFLRARTKIKCFITQEINDTMFIVQAKRVRADEIWFAGKGGSYHLDLTKTFLLGKESYMLYRFGVAEPLEYKSGTIVGHSSDDLDMIERLQIVKQAFAGLGAKAKQDIMIYVMMGVLAVACLAIGYLLGSSGAVNHILPNSPPVTTHP